LTNPTFFTVVGDFASIIADTIDDVDYDPQIGELTATVTFTPLVKPGSLVRATTATPRATAYGLSKISGFIDTDGRLKLRSALDVGSWKKHSGSYDYAPVRLVADTGYLELTGDLFYSVTFSDVVYDGREHKISGFAFQAPTVDVELNLISLLGASFAGITYPAPPNGIAILPTGIRVERKQLIFTVQGVDIPSPIDVRGFGELTAAELEAVRQELLRGIKVVDDKIVVTNPKTGEMLVWNGTAWINTAAGYTRSEVDGKLSGLASGLARKPAVVDMLNDPPATPAVGATYIIDKTPTGDWVGHANETVFWDGSQWVFGTPNKGDTHTVLSSNASMTWNGTDWVSVGSQAVKLGELDDVTLGAIPASGDVVSWDGGKWVNNPVPKPTLGEIADVDLLGVQPNQVLEFDGMDWVPVSLPGRNLDSLDDVDVPAPLNGDILSFDLYSNQWVGVAPQLVTSPLNGLTDVTAITPSEGDVLRWDAVAGQWVNRVLSTSLAALPDVDVSALNNGDMLAWDGSKWVPVVLRLDTENVEDVMVLAPQNEDFLVFNGAEWENRPVPLGDLSDLALTGGTDGEVLTFDGGVWINQAPAAAPTTLDALTDTDVFTSTPVDGQVLAFDNATSQWVNKELPGYTKTEVDAKLGSLVTGFAHGESVNSITATPPSAPVEGDLVIVATGATGAFSGHVNSLALWHGGKWEVDGHTVSELIGLTEPLAVWIDGKWVFTPPEAKETHLVEDQDALFHWNGTTWVKVSTTNRTPALADLTDVRKPITPSVGQVLAYNSDSKWAPVNLTPYPKMLGYVTSNNDLSAGKALSYRINAQVGHTYRIACSISAFYDNEGDQFSGSIHEQIGSGDNILVIGQSVTMGGKYKSSFYIQALSTPNVDGSVEFSMFVDNFSSGVVIKRSFLTVEDLGPPA